MPTVVEIDDNDESRLEELQAEIRLRTGEKVTQQELLTQLIDGAYESPEDVIDSFRRPTVPLSEDQKAAMRRGRVSSGVDAESKVSGNQANIPARIRRELGIDDGDHLRWHLDGEGSVRVEVVQQRRGTFDDFQGYDGGQDTDVVTDHDSWGVG